MSEAMECRGSSGRAKLATLIGCLARSVALGALVVCLQASAAHAEPAWTTYHHDAARSGDDTEAGEPIAPVQAWQSENLGAPIWGQPLVLGERVYVATVGDQIYALNAATGAVEWWQSAGTPVPSGELSCGDIEPTVGIVGTPVIDPATGVIYAVADTWNASAHEAEHVLKGYRLSNGEQVMSTPVDPPGSYHRAYLQRTALNLDDGNIVFGYGGNDGDCSKYRGAVVAAPENGGAPRFWQVPIAEPAEWGGAVWAPSGPAVDGEGHVFTTTGNPDPPDGDELSSYDYSDSVLELSLADFVADPATEQGNPLGWFEPPSWKDESENDLDLSSAGPELLPGGMLFQAGKDGVGYLIDEAGMSTGAAAVHRGQVCGGHGSFGGDTYAGGAVSSIDPTATGTIFIPCTNGVQALAYNETGIAGPSFTPLWQGPSNAFGPPIVADGLVWVLATGGFSGGGETLYGLDPATGSTVYTEHLPEPIDDHFASPSAAGGRLFVASGESVTAYQIAKSPSEGSGTGEEAGSPETGPPETEESQEPEGTPKKSPEGATTSENQSGSTGNTTTGAGCTSSQCAPAATTSSAAGPPTVRPAMTQNHAPPPLLLSSHLHADSSGHVRVGLRCPPTTRKCAGTVTLIAEIPSTVHHDGSSSRRAVPITLARQSFVGTGKDFAIALSLDATAEAHLRHHHDRLTVRVVITVRGDPARRVSTVLT